MGVHMAPWTERLLHELEQSPRPVEWIIGATQGLVPPGRAWRVREWDRARRARRHRPAGVPRPDEPTDDKIRTGQRRVIRMAINSMRQRGRLESFWVDGVEWIRIRRGRIDFTPEQRSEISRRAAITRRKSSTPKQRSERGRRAALSGSAEERSERARRAAQSLSPEERSDRSRRGALALTPEQRSARAILSWETRRTRQEQSDDE